MAPRQRLSPPPSMEDLSSAAASSSAEGPSSSLGSPSDRRPLLSSAGESKLSSSFGSSQAPTEADVARERHDFFNLVALLPVIGLILVNFDPHLIVRGYGPGEAWTGQYFYESVVATYLYFIVDLLWVARVPICVKSPDVIIKHHLLALIYLGAPMLWPEYQWFMGACLSVEINTWFLILRRVVYKRRDRLPNAVTEFVSASFYISWIVVRCLLYPLIMVTFVQMAVQAIQETGILWHWPMICMPVHFFFCVLNLKWSYDLFEPMIRKYLSSNGSCTPEAPSSGL